MVAIQAGTITVDAEGDGIKSTNDTDASKGFVAIADGTFNIQSGSDGIQAETALVTDGGTYNIVTAGGSVNAPAKVEEGPGRGFGGRGGFGGDGAMNGGTPPTDMGTPPDGEPLLTCQQCQIAMATPIAVQQRTPRSRQIPVRLALQQHHLNPTLMQTMQRRQQRKSLQAPKPLKPEPILQSMVEHTQSTPWMIPFIATAMSP